jgi:hypothetical protein
MSAQDEVWVYGLCLPGCLYDADGGPFDTERAAREAAEQHLSEYGNRHYIAEVFSLTQSEANNFFENQHFA